MDHPHDHSDDSNWKTRANWVLVGFLAIGGFFLFTEHRAHLVGFVPFLPFLLLLACPLMHLFMHHGHGDHRHEGGTRGQGGSASRAAEPKQDAPGSQPHSH